MPVYVQALLEKTADSLEDLQRTLSHGEEDRRAAGAQTARLTEALAALVDRMGAEQGAAAKIAESQAEIGPALQRLADGGSGASTRRRARISVTSMSTSRRLVEETVAGRAHLASEMRAEIKLLGRMISASPMAANAAPRDGEAPPAPGAPAPQSPAAPRQPPMPPPAGARRGRP